MLNDFRPDVGERTITVTMGFGMHTEEMEFICRKIEERRNMTIGIFFARLHDMLEDELKGLNLPKDDLPTVRETQEYGGLQFTIRIEDREHEPQVLLACQRAARLFWGKYNFSRTPEVKRPKRGPVLPNL